MANTLFKRKTLDQVISVPDEIIDVYVVEDHIWADKGRRSEAESKAGTQDGHGLPDRSGSQHC